MRIAASREGGAAGGNALVEPLAQAVFPPPASPPPLSHHTTPTRRAVTLFASRRSLTAQLLAPRARLVVQEGGRLDGLTQLVDALASRVQVCHRARGVTHRPQAAMRDTGGATRAIDLWSQAYAPLAMNYTSPMQGSREVAWQNRPYPKKFPKEEATDDDALGDQRYLSVI